MKLDKNKKNLIQKALDDFSAKARKQYRKEKSKEKKRQTDYTDREERIIKHLIWSHLQGHITQSKAAEIWGVSTSQWRKIENSINYHA